MIYLSSIDFADCIFIALSHLIGGLQPTQSIPLLLSLGFPKSIGETVKESPQTNAHDVGRWLKNGSYSIVDDGMIMMMIHHDVK